MLLNTNKSAVILGSGIAGLTAAKMLSQNGLDVTVIEQSPKVGGHVADWSCKATSECQVCHCCSLSDALASIDDLPVRILAGSELDAIMRDPEGKLSAVKVFTGETGAIREIQADALVLSTGFESFDPREKILWGYGTIPGVLTLADLDDIFRNERLDEFASASDRFRIAFFQCVGSRDKSVGANYCSQYCCKAALRSAIKIGTLKPEWDITIFYIDLQVAGKYAESLLREAERIGINLAQGVPGEISMAENDTLSVIHERDGLNVTDRFDRIILSAGMRPGSSSSILSQITGVQLNDFGFFLNRSVTDRSRTSVQGVYLAGCCAGPMDIETTMLSASSAAADVICDLSSRPKGS